MSAQRPQIIQENQSLAEITTFEIGGPARYFAEPQEIKQILEIVAWARQENLELYPLGGGSNILASDAGYNGLILRPDNRTIEVLEQSGDQVLIRAGAGTIWDDLVDYTVKREWEGLECLSGIPGRVGASPIQNIGAYGQEAAQSIAAVETLNITSGMQRTFNRRECDFAYRTSNFKTAWKGQYIITAVQFCLTPHGRAELRYRDLCDYFSSDAHPTLPEVRQAVLAIRKSKSMLYDLSDSNHRCAGSFFLNPIIPEQQAQALIQNHPQIPVYPAPENFRKISAAWLISQAGFTKGFKQGRAKLSDKHVLCLVNAGGAAAEEIMDLARLIQKEVERKFAVKLTAEPNLLGF